MKKKIITTLLLLFIIAYINQNMRGLYFRQAGASLYDCDWVNSNIIANYYAIANKLDTLEGAYVSQVAIPGNSGRMRAMGNKLYRILDLEIK